MLAVDARSCATRGPRRAAAGDRYFSSKGHDVPGLYALLIGLGMLDDADT